MRDYFNQSEIKPGLKLLENNGIDLIGGVGGKVIWNLKRLGSTSKYLKHLRLSTQHVQLPSSTYSGHDVQNMFFFFFICDSYSFIMGHFVKRKSIQKIHLVFEFFSSVQQSKTMQLINIHKSNIISCNNTFFAH